MRIEADLDLEGLESALASLLPLDGRIRPRALRLDGESLRIDVEAPMAGKLGLLARVEPRAGGLTLSDFRIEGARLFQGVVLGMLRARVTALDQRSGPFHVFGESDGERLHVCWDARP